MIAATESILRLMESQEVHKQSIKSNSRTIKPALPEIHMVQGVAKDAEVTRCNYANVKEV